MTPSAPTETTTATQFVLACDKKNHESLQLVSNDVTTTLEGIRLRIDKVGLSANNKFYMAFGDNPTFRFFQAYPVPATATPVLSMIGKDKDDDNASAAPPAVDRLVSMPAWGLATVVESTHPSAIPVGTQYRGMLPLANFVHLSEVKPDGNNFTVVRPKTHAAYNTFIKVEPTSVVAAASDPTKSDIALVSFPGIITGFGLYHTLIKQNFYRGGADSEAAVPHIAISSASSKVALALALYLKQQQGAESPPQTKVIGYTSDQNRAFVESTGLYDQVLGYDNDLPDGYEYVFIDIAGRGELYQRNEKMFVKALAVGNSQSIPEAASTFSKFGVAATIKMMLTFMGFGGFLTRFLHPKLELFLIMEINNELNKEWGAEVFQQRFEQATQEFCDAAVKWIHSRRCESLDTIQDAYTGILQGTIKPSEAVVVDVGKAVANVDFKK